MMSIASEITRREFLKCAGAPVVAFGLPVELKAQTAPVAKPSGGLLPPNQLDSWLIVHKDGRVTVMTGKVELGTGVSTSLRQIVADELDCPFEKIMWIQGDTANTVDQAPTFGSQTIKRGGSQLRQAAAEAKATLVSLAATRLGASVQNLTVAQGIVSVRDAIKKQVSYADLLGGQLFWHRSHRQDQTEKPGHLHGHRQAGAARGYSGQSYRRTHLCSELSPAGHVSRPGCASFGGGRQASERLTSLRSETSPG